MTIENLIAEGEYIAEQAHGKARTKTGKDYNNTYCRVWRIAKIFAKQGQLGVPTRRQDKSFEQIGESLHGWIDSVF